MITITIGNSLSKITGITAEQFKKLRELLSYIESENTYFNPYANRPKYLITKRGEFPTGLLYLVQGFFHQAQIQVLLQDSRIRPAPRKTPFVAEIKYKPYPEQFQAAQMAKSLSRGIICAPTGVGKSAMCTLMIQELQVNTLVVVPTLELKRQLTLTLKDAFGASNVGGLGKAIAVENIAALDLNKELKGYDCVIIDEFHHSGASSYRKLNLKCWKGVYYKFGLTATPFRSKDTERLLLESVLSKVIFKVDYQKAVDSGYIVPLEVYVVTLPKIKCGAKVYAGVYSELVVNREDRNILIAKILARLGASQRSTLCLVKQIEHGKILQELALQEGLVVDFVKGENDDNQEVLSNFNQGMKPLIGTMGVVGEGVDTKPTEFAILASPMKSKNLFMQCVGRTFRRFPGKDCAKVIMFLDPSNKFMKAHHKACVEYLLEEYGVTPSDLEISDLI